MRPGAVPLLASLLLASALGCDRAPSAASLHEWTPADHDRAEEQARIMAGQQPGTGPRLSAEETLAEAAWGGRCASCHGPLGHGDGPGGPMVQAPDLTREEFQAKTSDMTIASVIRSGKGRMPAAGDLGEDAVNALVKRIRKYRGASAGGPMEAPDQAAP